MCKRLTREDYLSALPEKVRDKLRKVISRGGKEYKLPCVRTGCE